MLDALGRNRQWSRRSKLTRRVSACHQVRKARSGARFLHSIFARLRNSIRWGWKEAPLTTATSEGASERLERSARGDQSAFAELVRENQSMVYGIAYHFLRDAALAEELAQDVFLHLYKNLRAIKSADHLRHWLRKVTGHRCIDCARRMRVRPQVSLEDAPEPHAAEVLNDGMNDPFIQKVLRRLVATLPERARIIVILRYQEDLDPSEIARALGMPLNTVKSHLRRSLAMLREKMSRMEVEI